MMNAKDVAKYMLEELKKNIILHQEGIVHRIQEKFGDEFVFKNNYGTLSIDRKVLREFNKIKGEDVVWDKEGRCWK
jgi:hypothetical protein